MSLALRHRPQAGSTSGHHLSEKESTRIPPLPIATGARDGSDIAHLCFTPAEHKRWTERVNKTTESMSLLDRQLVKLEKKIASTRSEELRKSYRSAQRQHRANMKQLESDAGTTFPSYATRSGQLSKHKGMPSTRSTR